MFEDIKKIAPELWENDDHERFLEVSDVNYRRFLGILKEKGVKHTLAVRAAENAAYDLRDELRMGVPGQEPFVSDKKVYEREVGYWTSIARRLENAFQVVPVGMYDPENCPVGTEELYALSRPLERSEKVVNIGVFGPKTPKLDPAKSLYEGLGGVVSIPLKDADTMVVSENWMTGEKLVDIASISLSGTVDEKKKSVVDSVTNVLQYYYGIVKPD